MDRDVSIKPTTFTVSRLPNTTPDHDVWSVQVVATGHGRWAVRNVGRCLSRSGEWVYEPIPSSRTDDWLAEHRWDDLTDAIDAALVAEPDVVWNGLTSADVLARHRAWQRLEYG